MGTYPNDPGTQREVEIVREKVDNVHRIVCPKDGPTNKADCLNWIYQGIKNFEEENHLQFAIFVMEDSEDIIHPLTLKLFNYLIPRKDMVQLTVLPLPAKWYRFTEGHYTDEFSENHYKNLVVREFLSGSVPSAGVGCAFSRRAIELIASLNHNQLFSIDSLTEDYDIGLRLQPYGMKQIFVKQAIERTILKTGSVQPQTTGGQDQGVYCHPGALSQDLPGRNAAEIPVDRGDLPARVGQPRLAGRTWPPSTCSIGTARPW